MTQVSNAQIKAALKKNAGVFSFAADELGVTRQAVSQRVARSPELQAWVRDIEERLLDVAEGGVAKKLIAGDGSTQRWYLELKGKARGYVRRQEVSNPDGSPLQPAAISISVTYIGAAKPEAEEEVL